MRDEVQPSAHEESIHEAKLGDGVDSQPQEMVCSSPYMHDIAAPAFSLIQHLHRSYTQIHGKFLETALPAQLYRCLCSQLNDMRDECLKASHRVMHGCTLRE